MATRRAPAAVSCARFSQPGLRAQLQQQGIECSEADLLSRDAIAALPEVDNIVFMAGRKFGSTGSEWLTWAMNAHVPALVAERFARSRIVAFSTACVYPFASTAGDGATEDVPPTAPSGEYANSCVARERMFQHFSHAHQTPGRLLRLSYAIDMRYGVLHDVAQKLLAGEAIDLAMGHANIIWQGEADDWAALLAHEHADRREPERAEGQHPRRGGLSFAERWGVRRFSPAMSRNRLVVDCKRLPPVLHQVTLTALSTGPPLVQVVAPPGNRRPTKRATEILTPPKRSAPPPQGRPHRPAKPFRAALKGMTALD